MKILLLLFFSLSFSGLIAGCNGEEYYTMDDFRSIEKIDTHVHLNTTDPVLLEQALEDNFRVLTVNVGSGAYPPIVRQREVAVNLMESQKYGLAFLTAIPMDNWHQSSDWQQQALEYMDSSFSNGAIGVKIWKNIGMEFRNAAGEFVMIDDPQFDPVLEYLVQQGKPLLGHIGEPLSCWMPLHDMGVEFIREYYEAHPQYHMFLHPENPTYEQIIEARNNMLDKHPDLKFIGAHLGSMEWSIKMMAEHLDRYPNMSYDMAHRVTYLQYLTQQDRQALRNFFIKYQDRLIYSTDLQHHLHSNPEDIQKLAASTWIKDWEYFVTDNTMVNPEVNEESFQGLKLPRQVVEKLYRKNAERVYQGI